MSPSALNVHHDEQTLGELAMRFRGTRLDDDRRQIAGDYSDVVQRLIDSGGWRDMPAPEDQLPGEWMPDAFFHYWTNRLGV